MGMLNIFKCVKSKSAILSDNVSFLNIKSYGKIGKTRFNKARHYELHQMWNYRKAC